MAFTPLRVSYESDVLLEGSQEDNWTTHQEPGFITEWTYTHEHINTIARNLPMSPQAVLQLLNSDSINFRIIINRTSVVSDELISGEGELGPLFATAAGK